MLNVAMSRTIFTAQPIRIMPPFNAPSTAPPRFTPLSVTFVRIVYPPVGFVRHAPNTENPRPDDTE